MLKRFGKWGPEDDKFLMENYQQLSNVEIAQALNVRYGAVESAKSRLGLRKLKQYTAQEDTILQNNHAHVSIDDLAIQLNRSANSIYSRLKMLGLTGFYCKKPEPTRNSASPEISNQALQYIKDNLYESDLKKVAGELNLSEKQVREVARKHGLSSRFERCRNPELVRRILALSSSMTPAQISREVRVNTSTVIHYIKTYGGSINHSVKKWTKADQKALAQLWASADSSGKSILQRTKDIAEGLGFSEATIRRKAIEANLYRPGTASRREWSRDEIELIANNISTNGVCWLAEKIDASHSVIVSRAVTRKLFIQKTRDVLNDADIRYLSGLKTPPVSVDEIRILSRKLLLSRKCLRKFFNI